MLFVCLGNICRSPTAHGVFAKMVAQRGLADLRDLCPASYTGQLDLFLSFAGAVAEIEVPDPYYGGDRGFAHVLDLVELASAGLLTQISSARAAS